MAVIQLFRIDKTNKVSAPEIDFMVMTHADAEMAGILKTSCYDCHSNEIKYPWYTNIAPVSWWIKHHINEGSGHLNFSEWGNYASRKADHKLEECVEMVESGEMPMSSYTLLHGEAKLSKEQQTRLIDWFNSLRTHESDKPEENS